ncbi:MAG: N-acetyl-gamma-glutamyl-phosphate reductase [Chloroflexi bacterium]|nr:N-acetyl-gamma-glutamyl-phosphate reductase [Chloroflexota bacterium]
MSKISVGIINVTGYVGAELARILMRHPNVEINSVTGRSAVGQKLGDVFPHLAALDRTIEEKLKDVDVAFSALPHQASAEAVVSVLKRGIRVIDTSADFRLRNPADYPRWYEHDHPSPDLLAEAVYGLPELHRAQIARANLIANPGCYPTCSILALAPAVQEGIVEGHIVVDSKSGVSGAGRTLSLNSHFCEANENVSAYALRGHRHLPEILQELNGVSRDGPVSLTFLPHLIPMSRGMMSSCYAQLKRGKITADGKGELALRTLYRDFYKEAPFVRVVDNPPQTKQTWGSNICLIYPTIDQRTGTLMVVSCLDNLVKGAAGQAVQNLNLAMGLPETAGLDMAPVYP